jgi:hypothetical protein
MTNYEGNEVDLGDGDGDDDGVNFPFTGGSDAAGSALS